MSKKAIVEAEKIIREIKAGKSIATVRLDNNYDDSEWFSFSATAYAQNLAAELLKRQSNEKKLHVSTTSTEEVQQILQLNELLVGYALLLPVTATMRDFERAEQLAAGLPLSEPLLIALVAELTMSPQFRARQKKGRFEQFPYFNIFFKLIDAAALCFYRGNFISCYLTLIPVVEGILIRWMGFQASDKKPKFEDIRQFFRRGALRQPCPWNIQFHEIYAKACHEILNQHFYKPSTDGKAHADFNRHLAAHLLNDNQFATRANCIRLFLLLDVMSEIYFYESRGQDPRFSLHNNDTAKDTAIFSAALLAGAGPSPEGDLLGTS